MTDIAKSIPLWPNLQPSNDSPEYSQDGCYFATSQPYLETFFAPYNPSHGAVIIFPGGGMRALAWANEGKDIALWANQTLQIDAFVVHYRLSPHHYPEPQYDARQAIRLVRHNAERWQLNPQAIGVMGFSIGGHLGLQLAIAPDLYPPLANELVQYDARPNWGIFGYPVSTMNADLAHQPSTEQMFNGLPDKEQQHACDLAQWVSEKTPPLFIFHEQGDPAVTAEQSIRLMQHIQRVNTLSELYLFSGHKHSLGLATHEPGNVRIWPTLAKRWLNFTQFI
ncbi:alpha/beta hydrolase [Celerinatantimonas diazotrophica]|uniref:Acetyl esterase/lipase n=1 Tax=Celerinatantimonas diazotrophica TaxID=412034 RepID=A0A4R1KAL3_9GAMM|nr:alpha/beta hydrolase [Celerinatantimonas diazotrophica]TCK61077.1 acetyl esterase/lipase [Celerinatantimonas diazotrophica]CAG9295124.1 hypothetical protein CEDIAZO_00236 [Celerinatantimonas diazotrophica]